MAAINDLIAQKQKKFGLVFEEHLPECTPLYEMPVNCGSNVALKFGNINDISYLKQIDSVCNAPDSDLWHTLIEADNYHALQKVLKAINTDEIDHIFETDGFLSNMADSKISY